MKYAITNYYFKNSIMKNYVINGWARLTLLAIAAMLVMVSCKDDDPDPDPPILVEDGFYIQGEGTGLTTLNGDGLMTQANNEVDQAPRATLYEKYVAIEGGSAGFNIVSVTGGQASTWGPGGDFAKVAEGDLDVEEPQNGVWRGGYTTSDAKFTVEEDGLYHIAIDTELGIVIIAKADWGLIGGATPGGWSDDTPMTMGAFDLNSLTFTVEDVTMLESAWKFRYSGGWKVFIDTEGTVKVNANFGGSLDNLEPGGADMPNAEYAVYKFEFTWSLTDGFSATQTKTGDAEPLPEYPEELYMIGASIGGWDWDAGNGIQMIPVHSNPNAFWRIVWIEAGVADAGIKFAPQEAWSGDFGIADDTQPAVGDHLKGSSNVPDVAASGTYMVWVDLERDSISITEPEVYLIGDAVGSWDAAVAENIFTVDNANEKLTITKELAEANLRMHAWHKWHYDWWQHEFNIFDGTIEYRGTGDDQAAVPVSAGSTTIDLMFKTGTGSITQ
jgi:hypothetical protein